MRVLIGITNYNKGTRLAQCVSAAISQSIECDVVVFDDGSSDDSLEVLGQFDGRITVYNSEANLGQAVGKNYIAQQHAHEYDLILFCDSDDELERHAVSHILNVYNTSPDKISVIYFDEVVVDTIRGFSYINYKPPYCVERMTNIDLVGGNIAVNTAAFRKFGLFDERMRVLENYDFVMRCGENSSVIHIPIVLAKTTIEPKCLRKKVSFDEWRRHQQYALEKASHRINAKVSNRQ